MEKGILELTNEFPKGSIVTTSWYGNNRCIGVVDYFDYGDNGDIWCFTSFHINTVDEFFVGGSIGVTSNKINKSTEDEQELLINEIKKHGYTDIPQKNYYDIIVGKLRFLTKEEIGELIKECTDLLVYF